MAGEVELRSEIIRKGTLRISIISFVLGWLVLLPFQILYSIGIELDLSDDMNNFVGTLSLILMAIGGFGVFICWFAPAMFRPIFRMGYGEGVEQLYGKRKADLAYNNFLWRFILGPDHPTQKPND